MLLRFGVENHFSLRDRQELSLVASALDDVETGLIDCPPAGGRLLPAAVIYGANASGKSNLISALEWMCSTVLFSHSRGKPGGSVHRVPFALRSAGPPNSSYDIDFVLEDVRFHYGFEASDDAFVTEWLYAFPNGRRQALFERRGADFNFGRNLKGRNKVIADLTRPNSLFLSAAAQNGHEELSKISRFFETIGMSDKQFRPTSARKEIDPRVMEFLANIGTGVVDYRVTERQRTDEGRKLQSELRSLFEKYLDATLEIDDWKQDDLYNFQFGHLGQGGEKYYLDLFTESSGTQRLLDLLIPTFRALDTGALVVIDELEDSLHTQACELFLGLFSFSHTNPKGAQLIATTHDTNILRSSLLRRDQVWFTEKDNHGATHLYPLTDIRTRKGDNLAKGYLQGRFGAIPFAGSVADLLPSV